MSQVEGQICRIATDFAFHFHALEKEMATHSSVLAWRIPWTEKLGRLQSMGSHRVGHDWSNLAAAAARIIIPLRITIPSQGFPGGSVVKNPPVSVGDTGSIPKSGRTFGRVNGNPFQYSCQDNPMYRGACWATVRGVTRVRHDLVTKPPPTHLACCVQDTLLCTLRVLIYLVLTPIPNMNTLSPFCQWGNNCREDKMPKNEQAWREIQV